MNYQRPIGINDMEEVSEGWSDIEEEELSDREGNNPQDFLIPANNAGQPERPNNQVERMNDQIGELTRRFEQANDVLGDLIQLYELNNQYSTMLLNEIRDIKRKMVEIKYWTQHATVRMNMLIHYCNRANIDELEFLQINFDNDDQQNEQNIQPQPRENRFNRRRDHMI